MEKWGLSDAGFKYNVVAVFGSQSTGKSNDFSSIIIPFLSNTLI
jgi:hypothetical protein